MQMSKKEFCTIMAQLQAFTALDETLFNCFGVMSGSIDNDTFVEMQEKKEIPGVFYIHDPAVYTIVRLLNYIFEIDDTEISPIEAFVYNLDFGEVYFTEAQLDVDQKILDLNLKTPGDLYDLITGTRSETTA